MRTKVGLNPTHRLKEAAASRQVYVFVKQIASKMP